MIAFVTPLALLLPALAAAAAAAAPAPELELEPAAARPGDAVLVTVRGAASEPRAGSVAGRPLRFWRDGDLWHALAALPTETPPGPAPVEVVLADGTLLPHAFPIREPGFRATALSVEPRFVEPPPEVKQRIEDDRAAFAAAYARPFSPPMFTAPFELPRRAPFSGRYGDARVFNGNKASVHYGLDVTGPVGAPIAASNAGEVVLVRDGYLSGNAVVLWHGAGVFTVYFHLSRVDVRSGQQVARGEVIGALGGTGRATGPHLHWSVRVDGLYVDPQSLLRLPL
jgi:murein DD-endopeptidase MepM/ murein hydrolase activator NlpD